MTIDEQLSAFDGANYSERRGQIIMPSLDTREELDSFSREELTRRVRWLYNNVGFVRGIVRNSATLVGWMSAQARTQDRDWNRKQEKSFKRRTGKAANFDRAGKYNWRTAQLMIQRCSRKDGDVLTVLTTNREKTAPAVAFYEAHQLATPENASGKWSDGVKLGEGGRHLAYGLKGDDGKVTEVPAHAVIYFGAFDSPGHTRAISPLAHAVNHAIDITETRADTKHAIKVAALFGAVRGLEAGTPATKARTGMGGVLKEVKGSTPSADGGAPVERKFEARQVWKGGQIPELGPGEKIDLLHDTRPHPNGMDFQDELIRDIACGFGTTMEVIYKMGKLTGPGIRFVMDQASRWIDIEQEHLAQWCELVWLYFTAWDIVHGGLGLPTGEEDWTSVEFLPQRDLTIDRGKDGRLDLDLLQRGYGTEADFHRKMTGKSWDDQAMQRITEVKFKIDECKKAGVPYDLAFPPAPGTAAAGENKQENPGNPDPDEEPEEEEEEES